MPRKKSKLDLHSIGSSPKYSIGTPPKKYNDSQNDPLLVKRHGLRLAPPQTLIDTRQFTLIKVMGYC